LARRCPSYRHPRPPSSLPTRRSSDLWYPEYVQAVRDVAAAERVFVVDNYADWLVEDQGEVPTSQLNDAIHPNAQGHVEFARTFLDRKSTRLNSSHVKISYAVFCLKKK